MTNLIDRSGIQDEVRALFAGDGPRIAIVAFIGDNPVPLLGGNVRGLEVYCWPSATGTSAEGVRKLIKAKAKVWFVDKLHSKIYWAGGEALIGSANLSQNGIGGGLIEHMARVDVTEDEIKKVIGGLNARRVTDEELEVLAASNRAALPEPWRGAPPTFREWWEGGHPGLERIRLTWLSPGADKRLDRNTQEAAERLVAGSDVGNRTTAPTATTYAPGQRLLWFSLNDDLRAKHVGESSWLHVNVVVERADPSIDPYPYDVIEVLPPGSPPFRVSAPESEALCQAWNQLIHPKLTNGLRDHKFLHAPVDGFLKKAYDILLGSQP